MVCPPSETYQGFFGVCGPPEGPDPLPEAEEIEEVEVEEEEATDLPSSLDVDEPVLSSISSSEEIVVVEYLEIKKVVKKEGVGLNQMDIEIEVDFSEEEIFLAQDLS